MAESADVASSEVQLPMNGDRSVRGRTTARTKTKIAEYCVDVR
jgi:hypothetical protein